MIDHKALIVVVDDDSFATRVLTRQLNTLGFHNVFAFTSAPKALNFIQTTNADTVLCDLQMPEMDGIEFVKNLGKMAFQGRIALVSGEDPRILRAAQLLAQALKLNLVGVLNKPVQLNHLRLLTTQEKPRGAIAVNQYPLSQIKTALDNDEFEHYFQPKVAVSNGALASIEALIRWPHFNDGVLSPNVFLETIQANGLCGDLLQSSLVGPDSVLASLQKWRLGGLNISLALNLSSNNIADPALCSKLTDAAQMYGVPNESLILEVSENRVAQHRTHLLESLSRLSLKGFGISIDDFGAGQTTMSDLRDLPITELKFDRGFVSGAHRDASKKLALRSFISMAHELSISTVAEGVEDLEDWLCLRELGCDLIQGYFVARPMKAAEVVLWAALWRDRIESQSHDLFAIPETT